MGFRTHVAAEIASQPDCWRRVADVAASRADALPQPGEQVAVVGCGTSWFVGQAYADLRERSGAGRTDAFAASEMPETRHYDRLVAISRSGTTTEVLDVLQRCQGDTPAVVVTADPSSPVIQTSSETIVLEFADELSVVQTRFATTALALLRCHLGADLSACVADAERVLAAPLPAGAVDRTQFTFLGTGWTVGLANEAALKLREAALAWSESYPAMEYRHGPVSITDERSVVWFFAAPPGDLADDIADTGALTVYEEVDPMAELIRVQRLAVAIAEARKLNPDRPRNLARSVILRPATA